MTNKKPILLFLSWRDIDHPQSGGAEIFTTEMLNRCKTKSEYRIIHYSTHIKNQPSITKMEDIIYIRKGNCFTVILYAMMFYFMNRMRIKYVVDQCNTHRFFTPLWVTKSKRIFFIHQFTREIWRTKFPLPLAWIGEITENLLIKPYSNLPTMTVSRSTKIDLKEVGFSEPLIKIIPEGVHHQPTQLPLENKKKQTLFLYVGRYSEYKGLPDATKAFIEYLKYDPSAQFVIIGTKNQKYIDSTLKPICDEFNIQLTDKHDSKQRRSISLLGRVDEQTKLNYMSNATALIYPSKREGWGLGVTEAAILGTPSIVYNSPGLVDAVDLGHAGYLCSQNTSKELLRNMLSVKTDYSKYKKTRLAAYNYSKQFKWSNTALAFDAFIKENNRA